jgi:hypothetical protein
VISITLTRKKSYGLIVVENPNVGRFADLKLDEWFRHAWFVRIDEIRTQTSVGLTRGNKGRVSTGACGTVKKIEKSCCVVSVHDINFS